MTFSPLTTGTLPHHNKYNPRYGKTPERLIIHHWAGTTGGDTRQINPNDPVSTNYFLYSDGRLVGQVPEEFRAWTSGSWEADAPSITVETQNSSNGGDWPVSDAALEKLVQLAVDVAKRYGWGSITRANIRGHREFYATECPGNYLWARLQWIADEANRRLQGGSGSSPATPAAPSGDLDALARAVIRGDYGNGEARRAALGARYDEVQARVEQLLATPAAPKPQQGADIGALADAVLRGDYGNGDERRRRLGNLYAAVQGEVNRRLGITTTATPVFDDLDSLARAVIRGDYGNGAVRRQHLGARYEQVQQRVNEILGLA